MAAGIGKTNAASYITDYPPLVEVRGVRMIDTVNSGTFTPTGITKKYMSCIAARLSERTVSDIRAGISRE